LWIQRELKLPSHVTESVTQTGVNRFYNQVAWARQFLVWDGLIDDSKRGVWTLTPLGWKTRLDDVAARELLAGRKLARVSNKPAPLKPGSIEAESQTPASLPLDEAQDQTLLELLKAVPPYGFELLCQRLLREHGFEDVEVTQKSRDGGIDGYGVLRLSPFVSLKVAFQAKRYKDVVGRAAVGESRRMRRLKPHAMA